MIWPLHPKSKPQPATELLPLSPPPAAAEPVALPKQRDSALRLRRNRKADWTRRLVRENMLTARRPDLAGLRRRRRASARPMASMPGVERLSIDEAVKRRAKRAELGIPGDRAVSLHRSGPARRDAAAKRSIPTISSAAPCARSSRRARDRHDQRRRARSLHQPRP